MANWMRLSCCNQQSIDGHLNNCVTQTTHKEKITPTLDAIVPCQEDEMKAYDMVERVEDIINLFPDHSFNGEFDCEGEEAGDLWRLRVRDNVVKVIKPTITWPED